MTSAKTESWRNAFQWQPQSKARYAGLSETRKAGAKILKKKSARKKISTVV